MRKNLYKKHSQALNNPAYSAKLVALDMFLLKYIWVSKRKRDGIMRNILIVILSTSIYSSSLYCASPDSKKSISSSRHDNDLNLQLTQACHDNNLEDVKKALAAGAQVNIGHPNYILPLQLAVRNRSVNLCQLLLEKKADPNKSTDTITGPPLFALCYDHQLDPDKGITIAKLLLATGADPYATNELGETPLDFARKLYSTSHYLQSRQSLRGPNTPNYLELIKLMQAKIEESKSKGSCSIS